MRAVIFLSFIFYWYILPAQSGHLGYSIRVVKKVDSIINLEIKSLKIPGAVILISSGNKKVLLKSYGFARRFDSTGKELADPEPMTTTHLFDIASLTKVIGTTTSIMKLVSEGRISVDDPIGKYLPAYVQSPKSMILIRHLLTHAAGFYEWYPMYYRSDKNRETTYELIASLPLKYPVGKQRKYSDLGFTILGQLIEKFTGLPLERYVEDSIFRPLGLQHSFYTPVLKGYKGPIAPTSFGNPYEYRMTHDSSVGFLVKDIDPGSWNGWRNYLLRGEVNDGNAWYANGGVSGAAGLFSTAEDLQIIVNMLMNKGRFDGKYFIRKEVVEQFLQKDVFNNGLGWMMDETSTFMKNAPRGSFGHTGFTGTSIVAIPSLKISLIILINRQQTGLLPSGEYCNISPLRGKILEAVLSESAVSKN